jgi:hypothetical protein
MSWANTPGPVYRRELRTLDQVEWGGGREGEGWPRSRVCELLIILLSPLGSNRLLYTDMEDGYQ